MGVKAIAAGGAHTCALLTSGAERCWGANYYGQLGNSGTTTQTGRRRGGYHDGRTHRHGERSLVLDPRQRDGEVLGVRLFRSVGRRQGHE